MDVRAPCQAVLLRVERRCWLQHAVEGWADGRHLQAFIAKVWWGWGVQK